MMNFEQCKTAFINYEKMIGSTDKTISHYMMVLDLFQSIVNNDNCSSFTMNEIYQFADYMDKRSLSIATRANYLRHIKSFYHFLCNNAIIAEKTLWGEIRPPKQSKKIVQIYDEMELDEIYQAAETSIEWLTIRNRAILSFMYDAGLRQSEIIKLTVPDIQDNIIVHGKGRKDRIVPIGKTLQRDLCSWLHVRPAADSNYLFLTKNRIPITKNSIKMLFQHITETVGYPVSSHRLRHNFATNYLLDSYDKNGWFDCYSLMILLGHEDISTTERYLHYCQQVIACRNKNSHLDKINGLL